MTIVSGYIKTITGEPSNTLSVSVRADRTRPSASGVTTAESQIVSWDPATGKLIFTAEPGPAVITLSMGVRRENIPISVPDAENATLEEVVSEKFIIPPPVVNLAHRQLDQARKDAVSAVEAVNGIPRIEALEAMNGVSPESPVDGQTANLVLQEATLTRGALEDAYASESLASARAQKKLMGKKMALVLRHDDVQKNALQYLPLYDELGVKASWYVATAQMGETHRGVIMANAQDIIGLHEAGHEIGSHTQTHLYFNEATEEQRRAELAGSKRDLENLLGGGYRCETFAYPGNWGGHDREVGDYYIWGTTGVSSKAMYGATHTLTDIDTVSNRAEYPDPLLGATVAETITKTQALLAEFKDREALTVYTLQTHNLNEVPLDHMRAILETVLADGAAEVVTMREAAHFVRSTLRTRDGRFHGPDGLSSGDTAKQVTLAGAQHSAGGYIVDRVTNFGKAFVAKVNGTVRATLDDILIITGTGTSRFENGHKLRFYDPTNTTSLIIGAESGGVHVFTLAGGGAARAQFTGGLRTQTTGKTLEAYNAGTPIFWVDTDRQVFYIRNLTELPSSGTLAGEMCVVDRRLYVYGGGRWIPVGNDYGATTQRPTSPHPGQTFWDTTIGKMIWWDGAAWVAPEVTAV